MKRNSHDVLSALVGENNTVLLIGPLYKGKGHLQVNSLPKIYIDGGANHKAEVEKKVSGESLIVGDGDSYNGTLDIQLSPEKDYSDLAYVLSNLPNHVEEIYLWGFCGGRLDHFLSNIGEVFSFAKETSQRVKLTWEKGLFLSNEQEFTFEHRGLFSLFTLENTQVKVTGDVKYSLKESTNLRPLSSHGLSNSAHGRVHIATSEPILVIFSEE